MIVHTICIFLRFLIFLGFALFLLLNNHNIFLNRNNRLGYYSCCRSLINFKYIFRFFDFDFVLFGLGFFRRWFSRRRRGWWFYFWFRNCKFFFREIKTFIWILKKIREITWWWRLFNGLNNLCDINGFFWKFFYFRFWCRSWSNWFFFWFRFLNKNRNEIRFKIFEPQNLTCKRSIEQ